MIALTLFWSDAEWNVHWNAAADAAAALRLVVEIAARLSGGETRVSYRVRPPWVATAPVAEGTPEEAAASVTDLWRREGQVEGSVSVKGMQYAISAITEGDGGQLSLESPEGVFGRRYDDLVPMLQAYAAEQRIRVVAPLQDLRFGATA